MEKLDQKYPVNIYLSSFNYISRPWGVALRVHTEKASTSFQKVTV